VSGKINKNPIWWSSGDLPSGNGTIFWRKIGNITIQCEDVTIVKIGFFGDEIFEFGVKSGVK
jgi:hypothetical protein